MPTPDATTPGLTAPRDATLHPTTLAYLNEPRLATEYEDYFRNNALFAYDCTYIRQALSPLLNKARTSSRPSILDAGCGTGRHLRLLRGLGFHGIGLDLSPHMLTCCRAITEDNPHALTVLQGNLLNLPFRNDTFSGGLLMFSTLGMLHTEMLRMRVLEEFRRILLPGGRLVLHVHNRYFRPGRIRALVREEQMSGDRIIRSYRGMLDLYIHVFGRDELQELLPACGLRVLDLHPLNIQRDGPCTSSRIDRDANGFLITAEKAE